MADEVVLMSSSRCGRRSSSRLRCWGRWAFSVDTYAQEGGGPTPTVTPTSLLDEEGQRDKGEAGRTRPDCTRPEFQDDPICMLPTSTPDTHIYAAPYVHAETHFDTEANKDANPCDRSADTIHTNRSTLPPWLDSRAVLCARWHVDTDAKADSNQHANGPADIHANIHSYSGWRRRPRRWGNRQTHRHHHQANADAHS